MVKGNGIAEINLKVDLHIADLERFKCVVKNLAAWVEVVEVSGGPKDYEAGLYMAAKDLDDAQT